MGRCVGVAPLNTMLTISQQMVHNLSSDRPQLCARLSYRSSRSRLRLKCDGTRKDTRFLLMFIGPCIILIVEE